MPDPLGGDALPEEETPQAHLDGPLQVIQLCHKIEYSKSSDKYISATKINFLENILQEKPRIQSAGPLLPPSHLHSLSHPDHAAHVLDGEYHVHIMTTSS